MIGYISCPLHYFPTTSAQFLGIVGPQVALLLILFKNGQSLASNHFQGLYMFFFYHNTVATCTLPSTAQLTSGNIANMTPSSGVVSQTNILTLNCDSGWQFADSATSKDVTCIGLDTFD